MSESAPVPPRAAQKPQRTIRKKARKQPNPDDPPKIPRIMRHVRKQIEQHPKFRDLPDGLRASLIFAYALGSKNMNPGGRAFARALWAHLYTGAPLPA